MKKGRFLWSAHRITERRKAGKARSIKEKQLKNSRNMVSKQLVEHRSSLNDNLERNFFEYRCISNPGIFGSGVFLKDISIISNFRRI